MTWSRRNRAFTLIELTVVVLLITILSALIVPRLVGNEKREFRLMVDQVSDLLTMYAQRETLGQKVVGLTYNPKGAGLALMQLESGSGRDDEQWVRDPFVKPVRFPKFMDDGAVEILADGGTVDLSYGPLSSEVGNARPTIQITLRGVGESATLTLYPYSVAPEMWTSFGEQAGLAHGSVNLDATGRSREDW